MSDPRSIGVFDSGVGGLTVQGAIARILPDENLLYLGDTARVPYGTRSADVVVRYALNNARTMLALEPLKLLVVACNTATAVALPALARELPIPVVGVIEPGAEAAIEHSRGGRILVLGTSGTVRSGAYPRAFASRGHTGEVMVRACPLLVPLVEEGWTEGPIPRAVVEKYLADVPRDVDTAVLGCTHYPLLRAQIADVLALVVGSAVSVVDGGEVTARRVSEILDANGQRRAPDGTPARRRVFVTDAPEQMTKLAPRFLGHALDAPAELVDVMFDAPGPVER
jgi:glutamate racemase